MDEFRTLLFGAGGLQLGLIVPSLFPEGGEVAAVAICPDRPAKKDMHQRLGHDLSVRIGEAAPLSYTFPNCAEVTVPGSWVPLISDGHTEMLVVSVVESVQAQYAAHLCSGIADRPDGARPLVVLLAVNSISKRLSQALDECPPEKLVVVESAVDRICESVQLAASGASLSTESFGEILIETLDCDSPAAEALKSISTEVASLAPYRKQKLWLFNAAHATAGYWAYLDGCDLDMPLGEYLSQTPSAMTQIEDLQQPVCELLVSEFQGSRELEDFIETAGIYRRRMASDRTKDVRSMVKRLGPDDPDRPLPDAFIEDWGAKVVEPCRKISDRRRLMGRPGDSSLLRVHEDVVRRLSSSTGWRLPDLDDWPVPAMV